MMRGKKKHLEIPYTLHCVQHSTSLNLLLLLL